MRALPRRDQLGGHSDADADTQRCQDEVPVPPVNPRASAQGVFCRERPPTVSPPAENIPCNSFPFYAFMPHAMQANPNSAAPPHPTRPQGPPAPDVPPSRSAQLLFLLRRLFDYGRGVIGVLQQAPPVTQQHVARLAWRFGTPNVRLIAARVTRGLQLAIALMQRIEATAARLDQPAPLPAIRDPSLAEPKSERACVQSPVRHGTTNDDVRLLYRLPTPQEIAVRVLRRPIGEVLADICIDLGITPGHPLWRQLRVAVDDAGGRFRRVMRIGLRRLKHAKREFARAARLGGAESAQSNRVPIPATAAIAAGTGPP